MKILYIYRNEKQGFSIKNVFNPIEDRMRKYAEVESFYLPEPGAKIGQLWRNIKAVCEKVNSRSYDIIHITGDVHYLIWFLYRKHRVVVTVHDLFFFTKHRLNLRTLILYWGWIYVLKYADKVTCVSQKTQDEVMRRVVLSPSQVCVIHNPLAEYFSYLHKPFNSKSPVILHIGTKPNKNLGNTILALKNYPCQLRIIGKVNKNEETLLDDYDIKYSCVKNLTNEEMLKEYRDCDIVNFPSFFEGFGMPIIEGQAVGRVVVTSALSPMVEVANDAAVFVNPAEPSSLLGGYKKAIAQYDYYVRRGQENIRRFSVERIAKMYYDVYNEIACVM